MSTIKAALFDADQTLHTFWPSIGAIYASVLQPHGVEVAASTIDEAIRPIWRNFESDYLNTKNGYTCDASREAMIWRDFTLHVLKGLNIYDEVEDFPSFFSKIFDTFAAPSTRKVLPGVIDTLTYLRNKNIRCGVITNNDNRIHNILAGLGVLDFMEFVVTSSDAGYKKPSPNIFKFVQAKLGLASHEILYVGDSYNIDYMPAKNLGWHGYVVGDEHHKTEHGIQNLSELCSIIDAL